MALQIAVIARAAQRSKDQAAGSGCHIRAVI
jgi:hypothetical protein